MTIYTLYLKIHRITGFRYLGQTSKDPIKYKGSGIDWIAHLQQHGNFVDTIVLLETSSVTDRNYWGRYYSKLWNVVSAQDDYGNKIYANRIPETGGGPDGPKSEQGARNIAAGNRRKATNPDFICKLKGPKTKEHRDRMSKPKSEKHKENLRLAIANSNRTYHAESARAKKLVSEGKHNFQLRDNPNKTILTCPRCNHSGSKPGMVRWHFDNCRSITY